MTDYSDELFKFSSALSDKNVLSYAGVVWQLSVQGNNMNR